MRNLGHRILAAVAVGLIGGSASVSLAAAFLPGDIVVYRVQNDSGLTSAATAVFLDERDPTDGHLVQSIAMPTAADGGNHILTASGTASAEGLLTRSTDGRYVVLTGYDTTPGTAGVKGTTSAAVNRVVGRVDVNGTVDTTTALNNVSSGDNFRSVASDDGNNFWVSGNGSSGTGVNYATLGATSATNVASYASRAVSIYNSQLYVGSSSSSAPARINQVGSGLPQSSASSTAVYGAANTGSTNQFVLLDLDAGVAGLDTLYVADDGGSAFSKWSFVGGSWVQNGTTIGAGPDDYVGLAVDVSGGVVSLYVTRQEGSSADQLVKFVDTAGYNAAMSSTTAAWTVIAASSTTIGYQGVALAPVPEPASLALFAGLIPLLAIRRRR